MNELRITESPKKEMSARGQAVRIGFLLIAAILTGYAAIHR